jgi:hypothetical protein
MRYFGIAKEMNRIHTYNLLRLSELNLKPTEVPMAGGLQNLRQTLENGELIGRPEGVLINGYGPYNGIDPTGCWVLPVDRGWYT